MPAAALPEREAERLELLRELFVLDSAPEPIFDRLVAMASEVCGTPIALLSLVDSERQWFKASVGLPGVSQTPRDDAFCAHAVLADEPLVVPDAESDARFVDSALVTGEPGIRFYAGIPLVLAQGLRLGTLCVIDRQPRELDAAQLEQLRQLAELVRDALVMRHQLIRRSLAARSALEASLERSEQRYRALIEQQTELVSLAAADGTLRYLNPAYARVLGHDAAELVGRSLYELIPEPERPGVQAVLAQVLQTGQTSTAVNRNLCADGSVRWFEWVNSRQTGRDGEPQLHSVGRDITDEVLAKQQLARQTTTLTAVAEAIPALLSVVGRDARYRLVNAAFEAWVGRPRDQILGRTVDEVLGGETAQRFLPYYRRALAGLAVHFETEQPERRDQRHYAISLVPLRQDEEGGSGEVDGFVAVGHDITRHKREALRLRDLSQRDALTGLLNRHGFEGFIARHRARGTLASVAFLYVDLDRFKPVNDDHGHAVGDELLQAFAARLEGLVRPGDAVARLGGDEFVVALVGVRDRADAEAVAGKLADCARQPYAIQGLTLEVGATVGVAWDEDPGSQWQDLLDDADHELMAAKRARRDEPPAR